MKRIRVLLKIRDLVLSHENPILNPLSFNFMAINGVLLSLFDHISEDPIAFYQQSEYKKTSRR